MIYLPVATAAAPILSRLIQQLARPESVGADDVTLYYCGWEPHPTRDDVVCLAIPEADTVPIYPDADGLEQSTQTLTALLAPFVALGNLTEAEVDALTAGLTAAQGQRVMVADLIPASWQQYMMDRKQAELGGWIAAREPNNENPI